MLKTQFKYLLTLLAGTIFLVSTQVYAIDNNGVEAHLKAIKRAIIWSKVPNLNEKIPGSLETEYGVVRPGEPTRLNAPLCKSYLDLVYAIVASDGELSPSEESSVYKKIHGVIEEKLDPREREEVLQYNHQCIVQARAGKYRNLNVINLVEKHIENAKALGYTEDGLFQPVARLALFDAIAAARVDGYAEEEREAAKKVSNDLNVPTEVLDLINSSCRLGTLYERYKTLSNDKMFEKDVKDLSAIVSKHFATNASFKK